MAPYTTMDWKKYVHALGKRDIRRTTAKVLRAGLDSTTEK